MALPLSGLTAAKRDHVYVLLYGSEMTRARYKIWETSLSSKRNRTGPVKRDMTIQVYKKDCLVKVKHSLASTLKEKQDCKLPVEYGDRHVLVVQDSFCSKSNDLVSHEPVRNAVVDFLDQDASIEKYFIIRTDQWLCFEVEEYLSGMKCSSENSELEDMTFLMKEKMYLWLPKKVERLNRGESMSLMSSNEGSSCIISTSNKLNKSNKRKARSIMHGRKVPRFQPFNPPFFSKLKNKGLQEVKAKYYLYDGRRSKNEARKAAINESVKAKMQVSSAVSKFLERRAGSYKFAFEVCAESCMDTMPQNQRDIDDISQDDLDPSSYNEILASRLERMCAGSEALSELERFTDNDDSLMPKQSNRSTHKYRGLCYQRVSRLIRKYPVKVTLSCIDFEYGKRNNKTKMIDGSISLCDVLTPVVTCDVNRSSLIKAGGSIFGRLIRSIVHLEGSSGMHYKVLKNDPEYKEDENILRSKEANAVEVFSKIWGVGVASAAKLASYGVSSIKDLRNDEDLVNALNPQQKIGLERYEDLLCKIPRSEIEEIEAYLKNVVAKISGKQATTFACGSYRRGALHSGDVDFLIIPNHEAYPDAADDAGLKVFRPILNKLKLDGFLTDDLTLPNQFGENNGFDAGTDSLSYVSPLDISWIS